MTKEELDKAKAVSEAIAKIEGHIIRLSTTAYPVFVASVENYVPRPILTAGVDTMLGLLRKELRELEEEFKAL